MRSLGFVLLLTFVSCASNVRFHPSVSNGYKKTQEAQEPTGKSSSDIAETGKSFTGEASYYADKFHGRQTASGETFNQYKLTCAHRTLPFGTLLEVTNLANNKKVTVVVNDRGPFAHGRVIDLSKSAAEKIDMIKTGVANVKCVIK